MSEEAAAASIPDDVVDVLKAMPIGYLSVTSKKGDLYSYPVAFHYEGQKVYFITPIGSAKMKFIKANPTVSFIVDNRKLTLECRGAMFQGKAKVFSLTKLVTSMISRGAMAQFSKKYPGMMGFYLRGKNLPSERKFYKYRLIRIDPTKVVFWQGYKFGRFLPKAPKSKRQPAERLDAADATKLAGLEGLVGTADEEIEMDELPRDVDWLGALKEATATGLVSKEEKAIIGSFRAPLKEGAPPGRVGSDEKDFLRKWRTSAKESA